MKMSICLDGVHAQTSILPALGNLAPIADQVRARLQRLEPGAKRRRRRLQALRGEVVNDRLLVRCMHHVVPENQKKRKSALENGRGEEDEREHGQP